jgi:hypothetical protein
MPSVLVATGGGLLTQLSDSDVTGAPASSGVQHIMKSGTSSAGLQLSTELVSGHASVNSFDVESGGQGIRDVVCVTDSQELIFIRGGIR